MKIFAFLAAWSLVDDLCHVDGHLRILRWLRRRLPLQHMQKYSNFGFWRQLKSLVVDIRRQLLSTLNSAFYRCQFPSLVKVLIMDGKRRSPESSSFAVATAQSG